MKRFFFILLTFAIVQFWATAQQQTQKTTNDKMVPEMTEIWEPEVTIVQPGIRDADPPSDAIILFNGSDINKEWEDAQGNPTKWLIQNGALVCVRGSGIIKTKRKFGSCQLHIEWRTPAEVQGESQGRGNSGVFLQELYEVQVLDSYNNRTYGQCQAGSIYKQYAPLVNVSKNRANGNRMT